MATTKKPVILTTLLFLSLFFLQACGGNKSDGQVTEDVKKALAGKEGMTGVQAAMEKGTLTLTGTCEGQDCPQQAMAIAQQVDGVKKVKNQVTQQPVETDYTLRTSVQTVVSKYEGVQADVAAGVVVLRGSINKSQLQPLMTELSGLQAKKIDNQLAVK
jgi:osmotically-inducible protein OsmY